ncbi:MAG: glycine--tRNA ligase subunit beta, partial [Pseudomonadota bacterium]|nr:glycine--tRNA ligase subunit beta [Pseudomonadota bacterium]
TKLANAFICTANIAPIDPAVVVDGNRKVLAARLADARFFWELDQKKTLAEHAKGLERITFHEKLGTLADKVDRVAKLARWLCEEGIVKGDPDLAEQAARLCKADLVTEMVGEFPELQGLMGGYYAEKEGLPREVSDAIRDHYKPVGQGDDVPTAPVTVAVSLADKLDTLAGFFVIDERPTGSKDPFALRRAALGAIALIVENSLRASMLNLFHAAMPMKIGNDLQRVVAADHLNEFFVDRLEVQQRSAGVRHDLIQAVAWMGGDEDVNGERDIVRLLARVKALQTLVEGVDGQNLISAYRRASNIQIKEKRVTELDKALSDGRVSREEILNLEAAKIEISYSPEAAEKALIDALSDAAPKAAAAVSEERFEDAMAALATLRAPIDAFFEDVTVNDDDPAKREARLNLLGRFTRAVGNVADFSRIEG